MPEFGGEAVSFLEIDQPECEHTYGEGPCTARLGVTGTHKCHNTRANCQDPDNISLVDLITWRFAEPQEGLIAYDNVIPSIATQIRTKAAEINLGGMERGLAALGERETVTIKLNDHQYSDVQGDKYRLERAFVGGHRATRSRYKARHFRRPLGAEVVARRGFFGGYDPALQPENRGSYWGKWIARNPYHSAYNARVREGYIGEALEDMRVRHYVIDRVEGPSKGQASVVLKDQFSRVDARKAVAPLASRGVLDGDISAVAGSLTLTPAGIGNEEYPAAGRVRVGEEVMSFTRVGDVLTLTARGDLGTDADEHDADDLAQLVLSYEAQLAHVITYDQLTEYSEVPASLINFPEWESQAEELDELYTVHVTEPTPVQDLIGELMEIAGFTVFPDVTTGMIRFVALRATSASPVVDDQGWVVGDAIEIRPQYSKRVSEVWVYYRQLDPTKQVDERTNYGSVAIVEDEDAPGQYGTPAVHEVFGRWIPQGGRNFALETARRLLTMFRDPPLEAEFTLYASKHGELELARAFKLETAEVQDENGDLEQRTMTPISIQRGLNDFKVVAQELVFSVESVDPGSGARTIFLENDDFNLVLRDIHDALYPAPVGDEVIDFVIIPAINIGSTSTGQPAIRTGTWPTMATRPTIRFQDPGAQPKGRIQGKAGAGGRGGDNVIGGDANGVNGSVGGDALLVEALFDIDNEFGEIWSGGGGGGGAPCSDQSGTRDAGCGGGSGAGNTTSAPGAAGNAGANPGTAGTTEAGGNGGDVGSPGLQGGAGGGPGIAGGNGGTDSGSQGSPGSGAAAGRYVVGDANVNWINTGDRRGNVA